MGKAAIIYVIGLGIVVAVVMMGLNTSSKDSMDSFSEYYGRTMVHNIATAGANIGTQLLLKDSSYTAARTDSFGGGQYTLNVSTSGTTKQITVYAQINLFDNINENSILRDTIQAGFRKVPFAKYAYFSGSETNGYMTTASNAVPGGAMWKITGDSVWGPIHTNGNFNFSGTPYFADKITAATAPVLSGWFAPPAPIYMAGNQWGVTVPRPTTRLNDIEALASSGGKLFNNPTADVGLQFNAGGSIRVRIPWNTGATRDTTYASATALAPNGIICVTSKDVRVQGTYSGQMTICARSEAGTALKGNVWLQGDLVAADNPQTNPNSTDMMGLVSERMTYVTTTGIVRNAASVTNLQATVYCQNGVFAVENYNSCGLAGRLNLYGGCTMNASTSTGTSAGGVLTNGMLKSFKYDDRYRTMAPPGFPWSDKYELISWWEK
jgi:hypothetical protein